MELRAVCVAAIASALACRSPSPPRPPIASTPEPAAVEPTPARDGACVEACLADYPAPPDPASYRTYCDERCAEADEPNPTCEDSCRRAHEPGGYLDDHGEYQQHEDARDDEQRAADDEACRDECRHVPQIEPDLQVACVDACVAAGARTEAGCQAACDPDPYDECRYQPCD